MREIFVISDTHLGHENILKFKSENGYLRHFGSVKEMNDCIVTNWNETVRDQDIVYHLGDVYFGLGWEVLPLLKGRKRLVIGNHDNGKDKRLLSVFQKVIESRQFREFRCILTHRPIIVPDDARFIWNIHGHIHDRKSPTPQHINVSVEAVGYKPVSIEELVRVVGGESAE